MKNPAQVNFWKCCMSVLWLVTMPPQETGLTLGHLLPPRPPKIAPIRCADGRHVSGSCLKRAFWQVVKPPRITGFTLGQTNVRTVHLAPST